MSQKPQRAKRRVLRKPSLLQRIRTNFLTGLVVVGPIFLTVYVVWLFIGFVDDRVLPWIPARYNPETWFNQNLPGLGLFFFLLITTGVGWATKGFFGRQVVLWGERLLERMPVVRSIYNAIKQIVETVFNQSQQSFSSACLVEYPRKGIWAVAFVSTEAKGEVPGKTGEPDMLSIFLPTTPNPTSGFLLFVPRTDIVILDMSVEDAAKLVISAGLVVPPTAEEIAAGRKPAKPQSRNTRSAA